MGYQRKGPALSAGLLQKLGVEDALSQGGRSRRQSGRKARRKEERATKKARQRRSRGSTAGDGHDEESDPESAAPRSRSGPAHVSPSKKPKAKSIRATAVSDDEDDESDDEDDEGDDEEEEEEPRKKPSRKPTASTAREDAEIASLERKLGLKGKKSLPKSFHDEGLAELLDGLDGLDGGSDGGDEPREVARGGKRKAEEDEWLAQKRRKAAKSSHVQVEGSDEDEDGGSDEDEDEDSIDEDDALDSDDLAALEDSDLGDDGFDSDGSGFEGFESSQIAEDDVGSELFSDSDQSEPDEPSPPARKERENPYVAPTVPGSGKYIPPGIRKLTDADNETTTRLRSRVQGLVNRLSEPNLLAIVADMEKFYREYPRQNVTDALVRSLVKSVGGAIVHLDTFFILNAAFSTAIYKTIGIEFGAHLVQSVVSQIGENCEAARSSTADTSAPATSAVNLVAFLADLYNFRTVGPTLIFDYIRRFLDDLSEFHTELLLRIIGSSGQLLRQDDPLALKDIVGLIRPALEKVGEKNVSTRTRFMVDAIIDLKNNKTQKVRAAASAVSVEHATRMKKLLRSKKLESFEPLRMSLRDIEQSDKRGKWWLVGASWAGAPVKDSKPAEAAQPRGKTSKKEKKEADDALLGSWGKDIADIAELEELAHEQGMNTDVQVSIFVSLLSAVDYIHAGEQLQRLKLNKHGKQELPRVLMQCVGSEGQYNKYYADVARQACSDRTVQWAFQASLWAFFKRMGETLFGDEELEDAREDEAVEAGRLAKVARMYGHLVAKGSLELRVLRALNFAYLEAQARDFVEVMMVCLFREIRSSSGEQGEEKVRKLFAAAGRDKRLARGLRRFLRKVVRKSELVDGAEAKRLLKACEVAEAVLEESEAVDAT